MKKLVKRGLSLVLALVMCLGVLGGISLPEAEAASYTYNWGTRGDVADETDFTRSTAEEWYAKYNTSYAQLSALSGSATNSSVPSSELYTKLKSLMTNAHSYKTSYDATKELYQYTDCQNGGGKISSFYSGNAIGPGWGEGGSWNREHTWPDSKGLGGQDENDIMMLRPTSSSENSSRGNDAYGESGSYYHPNSESGGKYDLRGDCARICLYVYTRWGNTGKMWGESGVMESREILLKWMKEDPVDTWELGRNDACQSITGTRNVFVDYPELGFILFGADVPDNYTSPSGEGSAVAYNITATSNNTSYGTVSLSGKTITATPKTGYYVTGYTVTSGSATVTQSGNTFKVEAKSDCTVCINFAAKTAVTLTFMENGITAKTINSYGGDSVTLPSNTNTVAEGYTFLGWTDSIVSDTTTKPTIYTAGTSVTASNKTYYAVYTYSVGGTGVTEWALKNITEIKSGDEFVITMSKSSTVYALPNGTISKNPVPETVTASNGKLTAEPAANLIWNLGGGSDAWIFYPNGSTTQWLYCNDSNDGVAVGSGSNNTFKVSGTYLLNNGTSRYLGVYTNNPDWRCYTSSSTNIGGQTLGFYVKSESGTVYYTTSTFVCDHEDTGNTAAVAATCTETGYTAGVYCNDCDQYISGHEVVAALGHSWGAWVQTTAPTCTATGVETATCSRCLETKTQTVAATGHSYSSVVTKPTETAQGYTTYTCTVCGHSYVSDYTEALGSTFYVSFSVPKDIEKIDTVACGKDGITLPTAAAPEGYTFLGWTTAIVEDTESKPDVLTGEYNAPSHITLYAVYSYVEGGTGATEYVLTDIAQIKDGDVFVITMAKNGSVYALPNATASTPAATAVTVADNKLSQEPAANLLWNLGGDASGYIFYPNGQTTQYLSCSNTSKGVKVGTTSDTFTIVNGYLKSENGSRYIGVYNDQDWRCYADTSVNIGGQTLGFYVKEAAGTTYYTTLTTLDPVASVDGVEYASFQEAYADASAGQTVKLLASIGENETVSLDMTHDLYIDLSGWYFCADVTANGYTIYGKDSVTDTFDSEEWCGMLVPGATVVAQNGYVAYDWGQDLWSFHHYELKLIAVSLKPGQDALGYKAQFFGDEAACDLVTGFGFEMGVAGGNSGTFQKAGSLTNGQIFSLRLQGIMAANGGEKEITASAFVTFGDQPVSTSEHTTSMKQTIREVNSMTNLTDEQKAAVYGLYEKYQAVMDAWLEDQTNNIAAWKPE